MRDSTKDEEIKAPFPIAEPQTPSSASEVYEFSRMNTDRLLEVEPCEVEDDPEVSMSESFMEPAVAVQRRPAR